MDLFAPLCSSCGECTWCIERVSAASPLQGSRLVVLVVVIVVFFTLLPSLQHRKERTHVGDWAPVAPCALSFSLVRSARSCPSSSSSLPSSRFHALPYPFIRRSPAPRHFFHLTAFWTLLFLSFVAFPRACTLAIFCQPAEAASLIPRRSLSLQPASSSTSCVQLLSFFLVRPLLPLCLVVARRHSDLFLSPFFSFAAVRSTRHLKTSPFIRSLRPNVGTPRNIVTKSIGDRSLRFYLAITRSFR